MSRCRRCRRCRRQCQEEQDVGPEWERWGSEGICSDSELSAGGKIFAGSAPLWVAGGGPSGSGSVKYTMANAMRKSISLRQVIVADSQSRGHQIETVVQQIKGEGHLSTARAWSPVLFPPWTGHTVPSKPIRTGFIYSITIMSRQKCVTHSCNGPSLFVRHVEFDATRHHHDSREAGGSSVAHPET
jgi:hypothetical protein